MWIWMWRVVRGRGFEELRLVGGDGFLVPRLT